MVNSNTVRTIIGIIGNVISFGLFASPMPTFYKIIKKGAVEEFSPNPYLATIMNCLLWVFYGLPFVHPNSILVLTINAVGLFLELCYIAIYLFYANKKQRLWVLKVLAVEAVFYGLVIGLTLGLAHTHDKRSLIVGILCVIFGICMYGMPLDIMRLVIRTKSVEYMPFFLSFANFLNGGIWSAYALLPVDLFILISNGTGALLGAAQLILYLTYFKSTPPKIDDTKPTPEIDDPKPKELELAHAV